MAGIELINNSTLTGTLTVSGNTTLSTIPSVGSDTDKFLMSNGGLISFATGAEVLSYIGAGTGSVTGTGTADTVTKWSTGGTGIEDGPITFSTNDSTFGGNIITESGTVLIGSSTSVTNTAGTSTLQVLGTGGGDSSLTIGRFSANAGAPQLNFTKSRNATIGSNTIVVDDDSLGSIVWSASDGVDMVSYAAEIEAEVDGTPGSNDMPGRLLFKTTGDGAAGSTLALTLDSSQNATFAGNAGIGMTAGTIPTEIKGRASDGKSLRLWDNAGTDILDLYNNGTNAYINTTHSGGAGNPLIIQTNSITALTLDTSQDATFAGHVLIGTSTTTPSVHYDNLVIEDVAGNNVGISLISGTANNTALYFGDSADTDIGQLKYSHATNDMFFVTNAVTALTIDSSQNVGIGVTPIRKFDVNGTSTFYDNVYITSSKQIQWEGGNYWTWRVSGTEFQIYRGDTTGVPFKIDTSDAATFAGQAFATTATSSGDGSSTLTTKGYVDGLITGATIYRGTWDPDVSLNSGYGNPDLSGVTQTSGYYYICSADGAATPNGATTEPNTWATGDWVVWNDDVGVSGEWQKIDNTSVLSGAGTGQTVALWAGASSVTDSETLGNAPITFSGNNATFAGDITFGDSHFIGDDGDDNLLIQSSAGENIIIDSEDDIILDANGADIRFKDGGTEFGKISKGGGSDLVISSSIADKDIFLTGIDGVTAITALTLDMSNGGNATFAGSIFINGFTNPNTQYLSLRDSFVPSASGGIGLMAKDHSGSSNDGLALYGHDGISMFTAQTERMRIDASGNVGIGTTTPDFTLDVEKDVDTWLTRIYNTGSDANAQALLVRSDATSAHDALVMGVYADGGYKMVVRSTGNVGIGTTSPTSDKLHVETDTSTVYDGNSNQTGGLFVNNIYHEALNTFSQIRLGVSGASGASSVRLVGIEPSQAASDFAIVLRDGSVWGEKLRIKGATGNVGIGTDNPSRELDVENSADNAIISAVSSTTHIAGLVLGDTADDDKGGILYNNTSDYLYFLSNGSERMRIDSAGDVGIGTASPVTLKSATTLQVLGNIKVGATNDSGLISLGDIASTGANAGIWRGAAGAYAGVGNWLNIGGYDGITFTTGNADIASQTERMRINSSGNVGIGTTSPSEKLHVSGNARVTGAYYDSNNSAGTSGQVLSSTATGTDWVSAGGTSGFAPMVKFNRSGINSSTYTMIATVNGDNLASIIQMTMTGTSGSVVFACTFDITVNHSQDIHVKSMSGDYTDITLKITSDNNEDYSIEAKHNGSTTTTAEIVIFPLANETITPTTTDPGYTGAEYEHTATDGWRFGGEDNSVESSNVIIDGNVGIGTTSPDYNLEIENAASPTIAVKDTTNNVITKMFSANSEGFIGTESNHDLRVRTNNTDKITIQSGGNVGIGTTSPQSLLHVGNGSGVILSAGLSTWVDNTVLSNGWTSGVGDWLKIEVPSSDDENGFIQLNSNGNVGIGDTTPDYRLAVKKVNAATPAIMVSGAFYGGPRIQTYGLDADANAWMGLGTDMSGGAYEHNIYFSDTGSLGRLSIGTYNGTTYSEKMCVLRTGNVGIGTASPKTKLNIVGGDVQLDSGQMLSFYAGASTGVQNNGIKGSDVDDSLRFYTGALERVTIKGANVGIGTTNPAQNFVVAEGTDQHGIELVPGTLSYIQAYDRATSSYGGMTIDTKYLAFGLDNGAEKIRFTDEGEVGIGTTGPDAPLSIIGATGKAIGASGIRVHRSDSFGQFGFFDYGQSSGTTYIGSSYTGGSASVYGVIQFRQLSNGGAAQDTMIIDASNNVGIGTTAPYAYDTTATKFHVKNASAGSGAVGEVARFEGSADADGSGGTIRLGTSNDRGMYFEGGRTSTVPYGKIGTTEYDGAKTVAITLNNSGDVFCSRTVGIATTSVTSGVMLEVAGAGLIKASTGVGDFYLGNYATGNYFRFHTNNANTYFDMNCGDMYWRQGSSIRYYFYASTANMTINGTLTQNSDSRVKENIVEIDDCIGKVQAMRGVYYNRTDFNTEVTKVGVIAQEVETVLPELILESPEDGLKSVAYSELTAVLINAVKEQQEIIEDLKTRIEQLEN